MTNSVYTIEEIQIKLHPIFCDYAISKAHVFGSYARGEATDISDIDILVEPEEGFRPQRICGIMEEAMDDLDKEVDVYSMMEFRRESSVLPSIMKGMVTVYDKTER